MCLEACNGLFCVMLLLGLFPVFTHLTMENCITQNLEKYIRKTCRAKSNWKQKVLRSGKQHSATWWRRKEKF